MGDLLRSVNEYKELKGIIDNILDSPDAGGNISVKDDDLFLIKPSGIDMKKNDLICIYKNGENIGTYKDSYEILNPQMKPSMEINFHLIMNYKYVVHYHPAYILPWLCSKSVYNFNFPVIDCPPGKSIINYINDYSNEKIIFLKNHGVIISANSIEEIKELYNMLRDKFFYRSEKFYTPDDVNYPESLELWLFRNVIENIASINNLELDQYEYSNDILLDEDEKYRRSMI